MDTPASLSVAHLRAMARAEREAGEAKIRKADEIDAHIDALLSLLGTEQPPVPTQRVLAAVTIAASPPRAFANAVPTEGAETQKSARYGIVTGKWLRVLRVLAETAQTDPFTLAMASDAVTQEQGKERRLAEIRRQFEPYLEAGYLVKVADDQYQFTAKGFKKVGLAPGQGSVERVPEENEPPTDDLDDLMDGSETALAAQ